MDEEGRGCLQAVDSQGVRVKVNLAQAKLSSSGHSSSSPAPYCVCVCMCLYVYVCLCVHVPLCVCVSVHLRLYLYLLPNRRRNVPSASAAEPHPDTPQAALEQMHLGQTMDTNVGLPCSCYSRHPLPLLLFHYSTYPYLPRPTRSFFCFATGEMHLDDVCCIC